MQPDESLIGVLEKGFILVHRCFNVPKWSIILFCNAVFLGIQLAINSAIPGRNQAIEFRHNVSLSGIVFLFLVYGLLSRRWQKIADQRQQVYLCKARDSSLDFALRGLYWVITLIDLWTLQVDGRLHFYRVMTVLCDALILFVLTSYVTHTYPKPERRIRFSWKLAHNQA